MKNFITYFVIGLISGIIAGRFREFRKEVTNLLDEALGFVFDPRIFPAILAALPVAYKTFWSLLVLKGGGDAHDMSIVFILSLAVFMLVLLLVSNAIERITMSGAHQEGRSWLRSSESWDRGSWRDIEGFQYEPLTYRSFSRWFTKGLIGLVRLARR